MVLAPQHHHTAPPNPTPWGKTNPYMPTQHDHNNKKWKFKSIDSYGFCDIIIEMKNGRVYGHGWVNTTYM